MLKFGLFFLISLCVSIAAQAQTGWTISVIGPQQILFEKPREHLSALLNVEAVPFATQDVRDYLRSPGFLQDGKRSRTLDSLHLAASRIDVVVSREQIGEQWIGITESAFAIDDHAALLTERWWVRDGLSFHLLISTIKNQTDSGLVHRKVFEEFEAALGIRRSKTALLWHHLLPEAEASETGVSATSGKTTPPLGQKQGQQKGQKPNQMPATTEVCDSLGPKLGLDPKLTRSGVPKMNPERSLATCADGAKRVWTDVKTSMLKLETDYESRAEKNIKEMGCIQKADPVKSPPANENWWTKLQRIYVSSAASQMESQCLETAGEAAAGAMLAKGAVGFAKGAWTAGKFAAQVGYYGFTPAGQIQVISAYAAYLQAGGDPAKSTYAFLQKKIHGFDCLTDQEQTRVACKFVTKAAIDLAATLATGGVGGAAMRAAKVSKALAEAAEAVATESRVVQKEKAMAVRALNMSKSERAAAANKMLGRKLTKDEQSLVKAAHDLPAEDLLGKMKILTGKTPVDGVQAGTQFTRQEADKLLIRTGITGEAPSLLAVGDDIMVARSAGGYTEAKVVEHYPDGTVKVRWINPDGTPMSKITDRRFLRSVEKKTVAVPTGAAREAALNEWKREGFTNVHIEVGQSAIPEIEKVKHARATLNLIQKGSASVGGALNPVETNLVKSRLDVNSAFRKRGGDQLWDWDKYVAESDKTDVRSAHNQRIGGLAGADKTVRDQGKHVYDSWTNPKVRDSFLRSIEEDALKLAMRDGEYKPVIHPPGSGSFNKNLVEDSQKVPSKYVEAVVLKRLRDRGANLTILSGYVKPETVYANLNNALWDLDAPKGHGPAAHLIQQLFTRETLGDAQARTFFEQMQIPHNNVVWEFVYEGGAPRADFTPSFAVTGINHSLASIIRAP